MSDIDDGFIYLVTVEYDSQSENTLGKFKFVQNAFLVAKLIMNYLQQTPIVRIINLETKECIGSFQKEIKNLEKKTTVL